MTGFKLINICGSAKLTHSSLSPTITLTSVQMSPDLSITHEISSLCASLAVAGRFCYGYLAEEDCRYYVYDVSQHRAEAICSVTLDQMLRGEILPPLTRSQRYTLSLIIASTYLQLLDSPWLLVAPKRSDILFLRDDDHPSLFRLDEPHICHDFVHPFKHNPSVKAEKCFNFAEALDYLGIMLLELCFGRIMEEQSWRKLLPVGENDQERAGFDVLAAREWQRHVNGEAGEDYAEAVSWCLGGNRSAPPERWRQEMLRRVIHPLQNCRDYLANGGGAL